ncbi:hypothetical protein VNO80_27002 [Phaseolus coccineus]|uniref:Uncharacterized protein n=1 Tax=Phaseolus coccineus TaxID=3886 RepID=A0AAN9QEZ5_PHACN
MTSHRSPWNRNRNHNHNRLRIRLITLRDFLMVMILMLVNPSRRLLGLQDRDDVLGKLKGLWKIMLGTKMSVKPQIKLGNLPKTCFKIRALEQFRAIYLDLEIL